MAVAVASRGLYAQAMGWTNIIHGLYNVQCYNAEARNGRKSSFSPTRIIPLSNLRKRVVARVLCKGREKDTERNNWSRQLSREIVVAKQPDDGATLSSKDRVESVHSFLTPIPMPPMNLIESARIRRRSYNANLTSLQSSNRKNRRSILLLLFDGVFVISHMGQ